MNFLSSNFNVAYANILEQLLSNPDYRILTRKDERLLEFLNFSFTLKDSRMCFALCRGMSMDYLKGEIDFYLSGSPFLKDIAKHSKFWLDVTDDGITVNSNYGKLLLHDENSHGYTQFRYANDMLLRNPSSKKAVMTIYDKENAFKSNDNPCTMFLQFFIRDGKLHLFVKMRSSDIWYGMPYDVPFFCLIQFLMLQELRKRYSTLEIGPYYHQSGTLHLYERNFDSVKKIFSAGSKNPFTERKEEQIKLFEEIILGGIERWKEKN